jgi:excisionase family DNA binding protein
VTRRTKIGLIPCYRDCMKENLMTVQEVAEHLRLHRVTVYKWAKKGRIPAIRLGYGLRFRPSDIEELEEIGYLPACRTGQSRPLPTPVAY